MCSLHVVVIYWSSPQVDDFTGIKGRAFTGFDEALQFTLDFEMTHSRKLFKQKTKCRQKDIGIVRTCATNPARKAANGCQFYFCIGHFNPLSKNTGFQTMSCRYVQRNCTYPMANNYVQTPVGTCTLLMSVDCE